MIAWIKKAGLWIVGIVTLLLGIKFISGKTLNNITGTKIKELQIEIDSLKKKIETDKDKVKEINDKIKEKEAEIKKLEDQSKVDLSTMTTKDKLKLFNEIGVSHNKEEG